MTSSSSSSSSASLAPLRIGPVDDRGRVHDAFAPDSDAAAEPRRWKVATTPGDAAPESGCWIQFRLAGSTAEVVGEVLAQSDSALAEIYDLVAQRGLSPLHPPEVMAHTQHLVDQPGIDHPDLDDLTHLPFLTIDEDHSKDLDQALCIQPLSGDGDGFKVWYAIADAAWFVRPDNALFDEALRRGATYYLPGLVIPMLPKVLSEGIVSLNPDVDRRALVFEVDLDDDGRVIRTALRRGRVRSRVKTSYDAVQAYFDGDVPLPGLAAPGDRPEIAETLELLQQVGLRRMELAESRDVIAIRRTEIALSLGGREGLRFVAMAAPRNDVERYNEQISLLCNIEGARFLADGDTDEDDVQAIFRVHDPPTRERLDRFEREVRSLVRLYDLDPDVWRWRRRGQSLAAYLKSLPVGSRHDRVARAIHRQAMLTGGRSLYDTAPGFHFGVGADAYARFTAPMREMVGVFSHKEAWEKLGLETPRPRSADEALRKKILQLANDARQTQRELDRETNRRVLDQLFGDDLEGHGDTERVLRRGIILGISRSKLHIGLDEPPIDVKVYLHDLRRQLGTRVVQGRDGMTVRRSSDGHRLFTVGQEVDLRVRRRDRKRDRWVLDLLEVAATGRR